MMTAAEQWALIVPSAALSLCAPRGEPGAGVKTVDQDWKTMATTVTFDDGSKLCFSEMESKVVS